jgi:hypothetical protein
MRFVIWSRCLIIVRCFIYNVNSSIDRVWCLDTGSSLINGTRHQEILLDVLATRDVLKQICRHEKRDGDD